MASRFGDIFAAYGLPQLFESLGQSITYTPVATGVGASITAIVDYDNDEMLAGMDGTIDDRTATLTVYDAATVGVAAPAVRDRVTIDGDYWYVSEVLERSDKGKNVLKIRRTERAEAGQQNYRLQR